MSSAAVVIVTLRVLDIAAASLVSVTLKVPQMKITEFANSVDLYDVAQTEQLKMSHLI